MSRNPVICLAIVAVGLLSSTQTPVLTAQTRDSRLDKLAMDTAELKRTVADQDHRIAELEKTVKMLQAAAAPVPSPIPNPTPAWTKASSWTLIKPGMSEAQVVEILGPPTTEQSAIDKRTLYYQPDPHSTSTLSGSVTLTDDRVIATAPPAF